MAPTPNRTKSDRSEMSSSNTNWEFVQMDKYEILIYWEDADKIFVAEIPELPGCMAHGETQEDALRNVKKAMKLWISTANEFGDPVPDPKGRRLLFA